MMWINCGGNDCPEWVKANAESWARKDNVPFLSANVLNGSDLKIYPPVNQYQTPNWARTELNRLCLQTQGIDQSIRIKGPPWPSPIQACHTSRWFRCRFIIFCLPIKWTAIPWKYSNLQIHSKLLRTNNLTGLETLKHPWVWESFFYSLNDTMLVLVKYTESYNRQ